MEGADAPVPPLQDMAVGSSCRVVQRFGHLFGRAMAALEHRPDSLSISHLTSSIGNHKRNLWATVIVKVLRPVIAVDETSNVISRTIKDFHRNDIIHDSESSSVLKQVEPIIAPDGWKIQTYLRFPSRDYWLRAHAVHVDDISEYDPKYSEIINVLVPRVPSSLATRWKP
ncbi:hypothetical protein D1007_23720 [Hordeum vulgare]|nr:hypothetical protein D1007_23720 [Hordeum vulgare]